MSKFRKLSVPWLKGNGFLEKIICFGHLTMHIHISITSKSVWIK